MGSERNHSYEKIQPWFLDRINTFAFDSVQKYVKLVTDGEMLQKIWPILALLLKEISKKQYF